MRGTYHIEAPVETVFDFFFDPRKAADLFPPMEIREVKMTEEGTGTYTSYHTKLAGVPFDVFSVYTDVVPNKHITEKSSNAMVGTWDYDFEPEGDGHQGDHGAPLTVVLAPAAAGYLGDLVAARMNRVVHAAGEEAPRGPDPPRSVTAGALQRSLLGWRAGSAVWLWG